MGPVPRGTEKAGSAAGEGQRAARGGRCPEAPQEKPLVFRDHRISIPVVVAVGAEALFGRGGT